MRDANWSGPFNPQTERVQFAEALVKDCRKKKINAIAITDHHDLCLWKVVSEAANAELDTDGNPLLNSEKLTVFPGIELTLSAPPCQALLIFDPDLEEENLQVVWGALGVTPTPHGDAKTTQIQPLSIDLKLSDISNRLDCLRTNPTETNPNKYEFLKRRFILLPNVKAGGHKPIIRDGFHSHFASMPCVGGYIEGILYSQLPQGNRDKIEGKIEQWGRKRLGVFQTSDCRTATEQNGIFDFTSLGDWPTWVKWTQPSVEALRQACLASGSRISHTEPALPLLQIIGVQLSDSLFLGPVDIGLNPQFNAFIGGRGTGKSSLLEYIRWALGDDPLPLRDDVELPNFQRRRRSLIDDTLKSKGASVVVYYKKNEVIYKIERKTADKDNCATVSTGEGNEDRVQLEQIRKEFPIVSYAQKQLSCVGTLPEEITRLITDPIKERLSNLDETILNDLLPQLREQRQLEIRLQNLDVAIDAAKRRVVTKREQVQALQTQLKELSPEQRRVVDAHDALAEQQKVLERIHEQADTVSEILERAKKQLQALDRSKIDISLPNQAHVIALEKDLSELIQEAQAQVQTILDKHKSGSWVKPQHKTSLEEIARTFEEHQKLYNAYVEEASKNQQQFDAIKKLNAEISEAESLMSASQMEQASLKAIFDSFGDRPWQSLLKAVFNRGSIIEEQCTTVTAQASGQFRAELHLCGDGRAAADSLSSLIQGRNIRDSDSKIQSLVNLVVNDGSPVQKWQAVVTELFDLVASKEETSMPATPLLSAASFTTANLEAIRTTCTSEAVEAIRYLNFPDRITFSFKMGTNAGGEPNYIPFNSASPGQQATCLLRTLLAQKGAPLLIDQPEEDLDNEQIQILSEKLAETKHNRQLLFVSHNANIVVNGDAELVACFGYAADSGNTRGVIDPLGSIDCKPVREAITKVMEGGKVAFEMRRSKYGF